MANNCTLFSAELNIATSEERDWLRRAVYDPDEMSEAMRVVWLREFGECLLPAVLDDDPPWPDFNAAVGEGDLWVWSMDYGDVYNVALLVQVFLARFDRDDRWGMEWVNTCSKPRPGEFGGGAVFVTKDEMRFMTTSEWLREQVEGHCTN